MARRSRKRVKRKINKPKVSWKLIQEQPLGFIWRTGKRSFQGFRTY